MEKGKTLHRPSLLLTVKIVSSLPPYAAFSWLNLIDSDLQCRKNTGCHWQQHSQCKGNTGDSPLFINRLCSKCICKSFRRHRNNMICCGEVLTPPHKNLFNPLCTCGIAFIVLYKSTQAHDCVYNFKSWDNILNRTGGGLEMREL